ncbi:portal protein [Pantoea agglomerans]|uniref:portal protein n=1 Tax=Enterobacter agglomerans TaxID=549 RepID=UPI003C7AB555
MAEETLKQRLNKQLGMLTDERTTFNSHWRELSDYISPRSSRFLVSDANRESLAQALADLDNQIATVQKESKVYNVAATCFLRNP